MPLEDKFPCEWQDTLQLLCEPKGEMPIINFRLFYLYQTIGVSSVN